MKKTIFTGAAVALVTPFLEDGAVNYSKLAELIEYQIANNTDAIVACGTTGEASTLTDDEHKEVIRFTVEKVAGRIPVIAGTGSNDTAYSLELSQYAKEVGADAHLQVTPYYNKTTQKGLIKHFEYVADRVDIPMILYNVPSRTGLDIPVSVYQCLSQIPNIAGVKEASTDITKITRIRAVCPETFGIWSGNDDQATAVISLGGCGVISVLSNLLPVETKDLIESALDGDFDTASELQRGLLPLIELLFSEVNPIPVKAAMKLIGYDCGDCRLPLTPANQITVKKLKNLLLPN